MTQHAAWLGADEQEARWRNDTTTRGNKSDGAAAVLEHGGIAPRDTPAPLQHAAAPRALRAAPTVAGDRDDVIWRSWMCPFKICVCWNTYYVVVLFVVLYIARVHSREKDPGLQLL